MADRDRRLELVEHAYDLDRSGSEWLAEISGPMRCVHASAATAWLFEIDRHTGQLALGSHHCEDPQVAEQIRQTFSEVPLELLELFFAGPLLASTASAVLANHGIVLDKTPLQAKFLNCGFTDIFALQAFDPLGAGVSVGVGLTERIELNSAERRSWSQVAAHLAAGYRLRRRLGTHEPSSQAAAVMTPNGKAEHLDSSVDGELRILLEQAVKRVERARTHDRDAHEALELWQSLIAGQWSLADYYESSGRRYYVAIRNPPAVADNKALTRREAEVVTYVASGTKTQAAAYALGVDEVTVRGYLRTAMAKLGIATRAELISVRAMLLSRARLDPGPALASGPE
jgi:DNA-binding CsgD family transcriptional regulator